MCTGAAHGFHGPCETCRRGWEPLRFCFVEKMVKQNVVGLNSVVCFLFVKIVFFSFLGLQTL